MSSENVQHKMGSGREQTRAGEGKWSRSMYRISERMFYQVVTDGFVLKKSSELAGELRGRGGICLIQCVQERGNE